MEIGLKKQFLLLLAQGTIECGIPEIESVAEALNISLQIKRVNAFSPVCILNSVDENVVTSILSRTMLCKSAYELWGHGTSYESLKSSIKEYPEKWKAPYFSENRTFSIRVKGLGKKVSTSTQKKIIDSLEDVLLLEGKVMLQNPIDEYFIIEDYISEGPSKSSSPSGIYFTRFLCDGQRHLMEKYSLKERKLIGNTSMDPMLSFLMANLGLAMPGRLTCDPFVGSGSLLVSAAHFGSHIIGGDISYNILHARGKSSRKGAGWRKRDETLRNCLSEYGLEKYFVDVLLSDAANHAWKTKKELFDSIITDPPYGIREACSRVGSKKPGEVDIPELQDGQVHFPEQMAYHLDDVFLDLLAFAARLLVCGGRLVYWMPVYRADYTSDIIPQHPALKLLYNCEQVLNRHSSRRLIVMVKVSSNWDEEASIDNNIFSGHNSFRKKYFNQS
uniref:tRNA (guanine(10)-N(2))-methyltransferase TRMT11 n=1 Tax=Phallusia mammillata TaxID=59560 RepID=A0A6F9DWA5_9ASCI|nr:tRNA (guanine(10)-N2)-methyltransferase homolog [Phallusia mammillata]